MTLNSGYNYRNSISPDGAGKTTVEYLAIRFTHSTVSEWQTRAEAGEIWLDGQIAHGNETIRVGSELTWNRPGWTEEATPKQFNLVYQDNDLLVIDKPSGLPTIPGGGFYQNTLLHLVRESFPQANPLHRLGRATSGLVLFALNHQAASDLTSKWSTVRKQYHALSHLVASENLYDIHAPIGPVIHPRLGKVHAATSNGKPAWSVARALYRRCNSTVFEVDLHSGRPHQIRIHLAFIGHPLVGDPLYASGGIPKSDQPGLPGDGGYWLHAKRLVFEHPKTGVLMDLQATVPPILRDDFVETAESC